MNIFMPEKRIDDSVKALDDRRLIKQILECKTILDVAIGCKTGYQNHPVVKHYKYYPKFVILYASCACEEYYHRFGRLHKLNVYFDNIWKQYADEFNNTVLGYFPLSAFYCEGKATDPNCIRTTENTVELFRQKLCKKWDNDKIPPKWTNREPPVWYKRKEVK